MQKAFKIKDVESLAMAEKLGCFESTNWKFYLNVIEKLAKKFPKVRAVIYTGSLPKGWMKNCTSG